MTEHADMLLIFLLKARKPEMYREPAHVGISEKRRIIVELIQVEKDPDRSGRQRLVRNTVPRLAEEGDEG